MDKLFPSVSDAGNHARFEAARTARADWKAEARQMRQDQLAHQTTSRLRSAEPNPCDQSVHEPDRSHCDAA